MDIKKQFDVFCSNDDSGKTEFKPSLSSIHYQNLEVVINSLDKKLIKLELQNGVYKNTFIQEMYKKKEEKLKNLLEDTKCWIFITINPHDKVSLEQFRSKVDSIKNWLCIVQAYVVFEQRGDSMESLGRGFHTHIMLSKYTIGYKTLISKLENSFKNMCSKPFLNTINVKRKSPLHALECLNEYMVGNKQEEKLQKVKYDKIWRQVNNIDNIYYWDKRLTRLSQSPDVPVDGRTSNGGSRKNAGRKTKSHISEKEIKSEITCNIKKYSTGVTLEF